MHMNYTEDYTEGYPHLCLPLAAIFCCKSCQYMLRLVSIAETLRSITTLTSVAHDYWCRFALACPHYTHEIRAWKCRVWAQGVFVSVGETFTRSGSCCRLQREPF